MTTAWRDGFAGTNGTNVFTSHTPDFGVYDLSVTLGGTFVVELDGSGNARVQGTAAGVAGQLFILSTGGPADFTLVINFTPGVAGNSSIAAFTWRDDNAGNFYALYCQEGAVGLTMIRAASYATAATLGTYATGFSAGTPRTVILAVKGTTYTVYVDGYATQAFSVTDATLTTTNRQSLTFNDANTVAANRTSFSDIAIDNGLPTGALDDADSLNVRQVWAAQWAATESYVLPVQDEVLETVPIGVDDDPWATQWQWRPSDSIEKSPYLDPIYVGAAGQSTEFVGLNPLLVYAGVQSFFP
jgi:hypothetical protein